MSKQHIVTKELCDQIHKEFEEFVYTISHVYNAPLRHIKEFTNLLIEARTENTEEELLFVKYIMQALLRLDDMQAALLKISRLSTENTTFSLTDFNKAIEEAIDDLKAIYGENIQISTLEKIPPLYARAPLIKMLIFELIDNALKFSKSDPQNNKIIISTREDDHFRYFEIVDNGIGMDSKYHKEIFQIFRKLEPQKYSGIGAGLTIAKKIVQSHNGDIFISSNSNNGVTVTFTIPK